MSGNNDVLDLDSLLAQDKVVKINGRVLTVKGDLSVKRTLQLMQSIQAAEVGQIKRGLFGRIFKGTPKPEDNIKSMLSILKEFIKEDISVDELSELIPAKALMPLINFLFSRELVEKKTDIAEQTTETRP